MAKNYAALYDSTNDSSALEQRFYLKQESTKGNFIAPQNSDFFYTLGGGSIEFAQAFESSPHRSGRHHLDIIKQVPLVRFEGQHVVRLLRDQAKPGLHLGQRRLDVEVLLRAVLIGPHVAHFVAAEDALEDR